MCWLSTSVPSQSKTTNFNDLAMYSALYSGHPRRLIIGGSAAALRPHAWQGGVTMVSVAFSESLH